MIIQHDWLTTSYNPQKTNKETNTQHWQQNLQLQSKQKLSNKTKNTKSNTAWDGLHESPGRQKHTWSFFPGSYDVKKHIAGFSQMWLQSFGQSGNSYLLQFLHLLSRVSAMSLSGKRRDGFPTSGRRCWYLQICVSTASQSQQCRRRRLGDLGGPRSSSIWGKMFLS